MSLLAGTATDATPTTAGTEDILADFRAVEKDLGSPEHADPEEAPVNDVGEKPAPKKADAAPKKGTEGKKTAAQYAADRIAAKNARIEAREADLAEKEAKLSELLSAAEAMSPAKLKDLVESGRADDFAKTIGFESWEKLNDHFARLYASPEYKRIRELEERDRRRDAAEAQRQQADQQRAQQAEWAATVNAAVDEVGEALKGSEDPMLAAFGDDRDFAAEVTRVILQGGGDQEIETVAATILEGVRARYDAWGQRFNGGQPTSRAETAQAGTPNRAGSRSPEKPQKHVSRQSATEVSAPLPKNMTDEEWMRIGTQEMKKAFREEEAQRQREREA